MSDIERRSTRQQIIQSILQIFGLSSSGVGFFATIELIKQGNFLAAALTGIVSVTVVILAIGGKFVKNLWDKVLDKIEERLEQRSDTLADWIVNRLETALIKSWWLITSQFQGKYYQQLIYHCRDYRTQGLKSKGPFTLDLEKVFVPLRIAPESSDKVSANIIRPSGNKDSLDIWDILAASQHHPTYRTLAAIGAPGSGKTTLLEHITLTYTQNTQRRYHHKLPQLIPILLYLRDEQVQKAITESQLKLSDLIAKQPDIAKLNPSDWFEDSLVRKSCLVMIDGLDEVADATHRQTISEWVNQQIQDYPRARFIVTSRPFGYQSAPIERISSILEIQPFNLSQMQTFIHNWYLQSEIKSRLGKDDEGVRQTATRKSTDLIERIQNNPPLAAMALNPLLLTMIAVVHCYRGALPGRRVELYGEICDVLLGRRQEAKGIPDKLSAEQKKSVLQGLALELMIRNTREFIPELGEALIAEKLTQVSGDEMNPRQFLKTVENGSGLLVEREKNVYEFAHKSFQEYLTAVEVKDSNQEAILRENVDGGWWEETIRLYAAQSNASGLILAAIEKGTVNALKLALDCEEEGLRVDAEVRQQLRQKIDEALESNEAERFKLAAEVILARRLSQFLRLDEGLEIDAGYVTCAEYQLFLDETRGEQEPYTKCFKAGDAKKPITGLSWEERYKFCQWLLDNKK